jgi:hypothetical protein
MKEIGEFGSLRGSRTLGHIYSKASSSAAKSKGDYYLAKIASITDPVLKAQTEKLQASYAFQYLYMILSEDTNRPQPTVDEVIDFGIARNIMPAQAVIDFKKENFERFYPKYVVAIAKNSMEANASLGYTLKEWLDYTVLAEDKLWPTDVPLVSKLVTDRIAQYDAMGVIITSSQVIIVDEIIASHLAGRDAVFTNVMFTQNPNLNMGGFFSSIINTITSVVSPVLTPIAKLTVSPVASVLNKVVYAVLPDKYAAPLANLTTQSATVLSGKLNQVNVGSVVKTVVKVAVLPIAATYEATIYVKEQAIKIGIVNNIYQEADEHTGGLLTSADNIVGAPDKFVEDKPINYASLALDAMKVGAAVVSGGTAVAIGAGASMAAEETGLDKTQVGMAVQFGTALYLSDFDMAKVAENINVGDTLSLVATAGQEKLQSALTAASNAGLPPIPSSVGSSYTLPPLNAGAIVDEVTTSASSVVDHGQAELERAYDRYTDPAFLTDLGKQLAAKYGPDMLAYLLYKYGMQSNYDQYMPVDQVEYQNFVKNPPVGVVKKDTSNSSNLGLYLGGGLLVAVGAWFVTRRS